MHIFFVIILDIDKLITFTDENRENNKAETEKKNCDYQESTDLSTSCGMFH